MRKYKVLIPWVIGSIIIGSMTFMAYNTYVIEDFIIPLIITGSMSVLVAGLFVKTVYDEYFKKDKK